jgi:plastocyanin
MTKVTISEHAAAGKADQYAFTPDQVTIKAGEFITFSNQSDEIHVLVATPDAGMTNSAIDRNEDQPVQFTKAGTYTLESQDAKHRATMHVTVLSATGTTCGISAPSTTITFTEKRVQGQINQYTLTPNTVSLNAGQSLALLNKTNQALNFSCKPSADLMEGNLRVDSNEQQVVQFAKAGQYTCSSTVAPKSTVVVDVH